MPCEGEVALLPLVIARSVGWRGAGGELLLRLQSSGRELEWQQKQQLCQW